MRARTLVATSALFAGVLVAPPAQAGGTGMEGLEVLAYIAGAIVVADLAFTVYDVVEAARGSTPGRGAAIAEIIVCGPQIPAGLAFSSSTHDTERGLGIGFTAWTSALAVHGLWGAVATRDGAAGAAHAPGSATMSFVGMSGRF